MIAKIEKSKAFGRIQAPPSKSMAHRYLICSALCRGKSTVSGLSYSEDIMATVDCLRALGASIEISGNKAVCNGENLLSGTMPNRLNCRESGSTLRFMIPICLLSDRQIELFGSERLFKRSLSIYEEICRNQNLDFCVYGNSVAVKGVLQSGKYAVRGDVSSQFISGLMFALPLLKNDSIIDITGDLESKAYIGMTVKTLADFGVRISRTDERTVLIKGSQSYKHRDIKVEGDYSNAAFLDAFNLIGGNVLVKGLDENSLQGDKVYKKFFRELVNGCPTLDIADCPDLGPILMAVAAAFNGAVITGTRRLKIKESDRGAAMSAELKKFGIKAEVFDNYIVVHKGGLKTPVLPLDGHNDHRIIMSLAVLATLTGGEIYGAQAVAKSYPEFFKDIASLGIIVGEK